MEDRPRWLRDAPDCPPGPCSDVGSASVDEELSVGGVADVALQRSECFTFRLALGDAPLEADPSFGSGLGDLADGSHVQRVVEVTVAPWGQPVDDPPRRPPTGSSWRPPSQNGASPTRRSGL